ncbi:unnamed protein product [Adineta ricciae]|uniref:Uncharacterized protein n=1 Tax=Adineta ricciae TaxID=249248 RepID=A0A813VM06_ADIRI|nr:unnamed protein product [Adineta ricciae]
MIESSLALTCYDCLNCPYPWSSYGIQTYGSTLGVFSRVRSCYKKEFYNVIDRRLDRVVRGALDRECYSGKTETANERSVTLFHPWLKYENTFNIKPCSRHFDLHKKDIIKSKTS